MPSVLPRGILTLLIAAAACFPAPQASADIGVALADPTTIGVSWFTHAGHSLVYLSGVCPATPVRARLCGPGEEGSIVTMYPNFHENRLFSWNIVPLSLYLQGSPTVGSRLLYGSPGVKLALEADARSRYLAPVCTGACPELPHSYWRDLVASTVDRDIFIYAVHSTRAEDQTAVDWLNAGPNVNHYRTLTDNCSDFTRALINAVYPKSVHRDVLNDLAMMSPKAAAHSFTSWARRRPELGFYAMHIAQQPGDMPRAGLARSGTEDGFHMKKYLIPAALIGDHEIAGSFFVAYFLTGRFGLYKEYALHPDASVVETETAAAQPAPQGGARVRSVALEGASPSERAEARGTAGVLGTREQWAAYTQQFSTIERSEEARTLHDAWGETADRDRWPKQLFPPSFAGAAVTVDPAGNPWLTTGKGAGARTVGLSSRNVLAANSDPGLAFQLLLGRVAYALHAKDHYRESLPEFQQDWALLEAAYARLEPGGGGSTVTAAAAR